MGEGRENTGVIDFWCLYFMLKIGRYIQAVWSMGAVVLRKNLSKCVISPLMEHRRKAILLIPLFPPLSLSLSHSLSACFHARSHPPSSPLHAPWCLHFITSPPSINLSCFFFFPKDWLSSHTVLDRAAVIVVVYLHHGLYNCLCAPVQICTPAWLLFVGWSCRCDKCSLAWVYVLMCVCTCSYFAFLQLFKRPLVSIHIYLWLHWHTWIHTHTVHICLTAYICVCGPLWPLLTPAAFSALVSVRWADLSCGDLMGTVNRDREAALSEVWM